MGANIITSIRGDSIRTLLFRAGLTFNFISEVDMHLSVLITLSTFVVPPIFALPFPVSEHHGMVK